MNFVLFEFKSEISKGKSMKIIIKKIKQEKRDCKIRRKANSVESI